MSRAWPALVPVLLSLLWVSPGHPAAPVVPPERLGPVWPIAEEDLRTTIMTRVRERLPELQDRLENSLRTYRAPSVPRPTTDTARTLLVDPSITVDTDVVTPGGRLIARAGDRVNPLRALPLLRTYLIINAADPRQLAWAARHVEAARPRAATVLLTEGNLQTAAEVLPPGTTLFPAPTDLFARFPIESVPARLSRTLDQIRIDLIAETDLE